MRLPDQDFWLSVEPVVTPPMLPTPEQVAPAVAAEPHMSAPAEYVRDDSQGAEYTFPRSIDDPGADANTSQFTESASVPTTSEETTVKGAGRAALGPSPADKGDVGLAEVPAEEQYPGQEAPMVCQDIPGIDAPYEKDAAAFKALVFDRAPISSPKPTNFTAPEKLPLTGKEGTPYEGMDLEIAISPPKGIVPERHAGKVALRAVEADVMLGSASCDTYGEGSLAFSALPAAVPDIQETVYMLAEATLQLAGSAESAPQFGKPGGVTKFVLDDSLTRAALPAQHLQSEDTLVRLPQVAAAGRALDRLGCTPTEVQMVPSRSTPAGRAVEISFARTEPPEKTGTADGRIARLITGTQPPLAVVRARVLEHNRTEMAATAVNERTWLAGHGQMGKERLRWSYINSGIVEMEWRFHEVMPPGVKLRDYIFQGLASQNDRIGIEVGGVGSRLFTDIETLSPGFFSRTAGISLTDLRPGLHDAEAILATDEAHHHTVIAGDLNAIDTEQRVCDWLGGERPNFILESMLLGQQALPREPFAMARRCDFWYQLCAPGGIIVSQIPHGLLPHMRQWLTQVRSNAPGIELRAHLPSGTLPYGSGLLVIRKHPTAPERLPGIGRAIIRFQRRYGYNPLPLEE
ncbi:MAG TPA: hypothetical protein VLF59_05015 [Candidatus Saccharimonadales bacterium]|nr:hypothetical protein [Candidatus Saccharimonadales bacterium]